MELLCRRCATPRRASYCLQVWICESSSCAAEQHAVKHEHHLNPSQGCLFSLLCVLEPESIHVLSRLPGCENAPRFDSNPLFSAFQRFCRVRAPSPHRTALKTPSPSCCSVVVVLAAPKRNVTSMRKVSGLPPHSEVFCSLTVNPHRSVIHFVFLFSEVKIKKKEKEKKSPPIKKVYFW